jgi:predicted ribosomally synthesized peptide with nif11-like leader
MSGMDEFTAKLSSDADFAAKIKSSATSSDIVATAKAAGIDVCHHDIARTLATHSASMSDEELESVTSGTPMAAALIK